MDELADTLEELHIESESANAEAVRALARSTTAEDLLLQLELAVASLKAPGWRDEGLVQMRRQLPMMYMGMKHQHQGPAVFAGHP